MKLTKYYYESTHINPVMYETQNTSPSKKESVYGRSKIEKTKTFYSKITF